jgi:hypothetical protein
MFDAFHTDAYFSLGGEVLLYFIVSESYQNCKFDLNLNWFEI